MELEITKVTCDTQYSGHIPIMSMRKYGGAGDFLHGAHCCVPKTERNDGRVMAIAAASSKVRTACLLSPES